MSTETKLGKIFKIELCPTEIQKVQLLLWAEVAKAAREVVHLYHVIKDIEDRTDVLCEDYEEGENAYIILNHNDTTFIKWCMNESSVNYLPCDESALEIWKMAVGEAYSQIFATTQSFCDEIEWVDESINYDKPYFLIPKANTIFNSGGLDLHIIGLGIVNIKKFEFPCAWRDIRRIKCVYENNRWYLNVYCETTANL